MDLDLLVTGPEFEIWTEGRATFEVVKVWRLRGKITARGHRGRSPLYRLGDLLAAEAKTRKTVDRRGGRKRKTRPVQV